MVQYIDEFKVFLGGPVSQIDKFVLHFFKIVIVVFLSQVFFGSAHHAHRSFGILRNTKGVHVTVAQSLQVHRFYEAGEA